MAITFNPNAFMIGIDETQGMPHDADLVEIGTFSESNQYPNATLNIEQRVKGGRIWALTIRDGKIPENWRYAPIDECPSILAEKRFTPYHSTDVERAKPRLYAAVIDSLIYSVFKEPVDIPNKVAVLLQRTLRPENH